MRKNIDVDIFIGKLLIVIIYSLLVISIIPMIMADYGFLSMMNLIGIIMIFGLIKIIIDFYKEFS